MATPSSHQLSPSEAKDNHDDEAHANKKANDQDVYQERISALPKVKGCFNMDLWYYQGGYYSSMSLPGLMHMQDHFQAQSSDIILASFPKSGTTWMKALLFTIMNRKHHKKETHPLLTNISHDIVPSLEMGGFSDTSRISRLENLSVPRLLSTHVQCHSLPKSTIDSTCKIVYICRDPKDVFISFWHFASRKRRFNAMSCNKLEEDFGLFCQGFCANGPYWDHVLSYWKTSVENPKKVLFLKYEDLKRQPQPYIKNLSEFIGHPFSLEEEEKGVVQDIVNLCSFDFLSNLEISKKGMFLGYISNDAFYRKGEVGDWKNHLTLNMAEELDNITKQKFNGYGLTF